MIEKLSDIWLFSDIDGTMGIQGQGVPEINEVAIRRFIEAGGHFGICTGRGATNLKGFLGTIPINAPCVIGNGCGVYHYNEDVVTDPVYLPEEALSLAREIAKDHPHLGLTVTTPSGYFAVEGSYNTRVFNPPLPILPLEEIAGPYLKFLFDGEEWEVKALHRDFLSRAIEGVNFLISGETLVEMLPADVSKGAGFIAMCENEGIPRENTVFIGDYYNDREMFVAAGLSSCVSTTPEELVGLCDLQMGHAMEGAVAQLIAWLEERYS